MLFYLIFYILGVSYELSGQLAAAAKCYNTALQLRPACPQAWNNLGNLYRQQSMCTFHTSILGNNLHAHRLCPHLHNTPAAGVSQAWNNVGNLYQLKFVTIFLEEILAHAPQSARAQQQYFFMQKHVPFSYNSRTYARIIRKVTLDVS